MKDFHDDRQNFAALLPRTQWGERSCVGVSLVPSCEGDEIKIYPCLYGRACTWQDLVVALLWCPEGEYSLGETLELMGREAHYKRETPWRVERRPRGRGEEYVIREKDPHSDRFGLSGRIAARLVFSPTGKINDGQPVQLRLADWYVFWNTIPHRPWEELQKIYADYPPRDIRPIENDVWNLPDGEPWNPDDEADRAYRRELEMKARVQAFYTKD